MSICVLLFPGRHVYTCLSVYFCFLGDMFICVLLFPGRHVYLCTVVSWTGIKSIAPNCCSSTHNNTLHVLQRTALGPAPPNPGPGCFSEVAI